MPTPTAQPNSSVKAKQAPWSRVLRVVARAGDDENQYGLYGTLSKKDATVESNGIFGSVESLSCSGKYDNHLSGTIS